MNFRSETSFDINVSGSIQNENVGILARLHCCARSCVEIQDVVA